MSGFQLAPTDGGCPVALPRGETVIGRGPLLGITDKRVSRKHAILEVVGDQLRIKPVHVNPCFLQSSENGDLLPLETHEWHSLNPGDSFSLLIDKYLFKVLFAHSDVESTLRKNDKVNVQEPLNFPSSVDPVEMSCSRTCANSDIQIEGCSQLERKVEVPKNEMASKDSVFSANCNENEQRKPAQRKRMLPPWMLQGDLVVQNLSTPVTKRGCRVTRRKEKNSRELSESKVRNVQVRKQLVTEDIGEDCEDTEQDQGKKNKTTEKDNTSQSASGTPFAIAVKKMEGNEKSVIQRAERSMEKCDWQPHSEVSDHRLVAEGQLSTRAKKTNEMENIEQIIPSASQPANQDKSSQSQVSQDETPELDVNPDPGTGVSDSTGSKDSLQSSKQTQHKRVPCMYGTGCYRKNPVHFQQFSHPGDSDYHDVQVGSEDDSDDRPECPYGSTCYRKNPQHKIEYKHTAPPGIETRTTRQKTHRKGKSVLEEDSDNDGEPNKYDLNDSFIDDEEEDFDPTDEDSDWEPDSEDKDNEDVNTLLKEAQKFVKTKK
ncbi:PREDICTED: aprataxin and PNK-like factor isoform X1 [Crocodylus porosus]|uniref:Aprataxin and PNK-like factor n=1 Tax=Crocodylus porosus TaxID=8502 RepID=A0A7M4FZ35_CROPO|nr:PREDICTED: aprataxin and PNK-like factor isoform X1 [Crocodylus porosus]